MAKAALPRSKAKNAYDLLSDVCDVVLAEPKRLQMVTWLEFAASARKWLEPDEIPVCGTVACVAGWAVILKRGRRRVEECPDCDIPTVAGELLGLDPALKETLFGTMPLAEGGSTAHVEQEVAFVRAFQAKHEAQLKAKVL
jgi:hypothetical protein